MKRKRESHVEAEKYVLHPEVYADRTGDGDDVFACLNSKKAFNDWNMDFFYSSVLTANGSGKASECIGCGGCERVCPQHLEIRKLLGDVAATFEKKAE